MVQLKLGDAYMLNYTCDNTSVATKRLNATHFTHLVLSFNECNAQVFDNAKHFRYEESKLVVDMTIFSNPMTTSDI